MENEQRNVFGAPLALCGDNPMTGFFRTGDCATDPRDRGAHVICAEVTADFLAFSKAQGNDLATPRPEFGFPGLKPGDRWCLCAGRWAEAEAAGCAPRVKLAATHERALETTTIETLKSYALNLS